MKKRIILIGGFHKARSLAYSLIQKGFEVTAINADYQNCQILAEINDLHVVYGDGTKPYVLEDADIWNADIAIALTQRDDSNLVVCELCKKLFHVKRTVSIVSDSRKSKFFYEMGIDSVVCTTQAITGIIEQQAFVENIAMTIPLSSDDVVISEIIITKESEAAGKSIQDLHLPDGVIIGCILRNGKSIVPKGNTCIFEHDNIVLIAAKDKKRKAMQILNGSENL